jgi:hypothetical protein
MEEARDSCQRRFGDYDRDRGRDRHDNDDRYR